MAAWAGVHGTVCCLKSGAVAAEPWEGFDQALIAGNAQSVVAAAHEIELGFERLMAVGAREWFCGRGAWA
jgi:hypothetical protein